MSGSKVPCAECGVKFQRKIAKQHFCSRPCHDAYHNRMAKRGKTLVPLMMAWRTQRNSETSKEAFTLACRLLSDFIAEDKAAGRMSAHAFVSRQQAMWLRP